MQTCNGLIMVEITQAKDLRNADLVGKSDPYAKIQFNDRSSVPKGARTSTIDNCLNPVWNQKFYFLVTDSFESFKITLFDEDAVGSDDSLGHATILRKSQKQRYTKSGEFYYLEGGKGGTVEVFTQEIDISNGIDHVLEERKDKIAAATTPEEQIMLLQVHVQNAQGLKKADWFGKSDPFVRFNFSKDEEGDAVVPKGVQTPFIRQTLNPVWNLKYHFMVPWSLKTFRLDIYDHDDGSSDDLIGTTNLLCGKAGEMKSGEYAVESKGRIAVEYIKVSLSSLFD